MGTGLGTYIPLAIYLAAIAAALRALFAKPDYALYALVALMPLQTTRYRLEGIPLGSEIIDILWLSIFLGLVFREGGKAFPKSPMNSWFLALAFLTYLCLWAGSFYLHSPLPVLLPNERLSDWKNYMVFPVFTVVVSGAVKSTKDIKRVMLVMIAAIAVVDWSFFRSTAGRDFSHFAYELRDAGVLGYAGVNGFAAFIAQNILFLAGLILCYKARVFRLATLVLLGFSVYCLLFSFSRGAYFATLLGLAFVAIFRQKKLLIGVALLLVFWQVILPPAVQERINMTHGGSDNALEPSAADRVILWEDAMRLYKANPVMGTGYDTYKFMHRIAEYGDTHNYYIKVMVETGTLGLLLLIAIMTRMAYFGMQLYLKALDPFLKGIGLGFCGMMVCAAVANFFGDRWTFLQVDGFIWVQLGLVTRGYALASETADEAATPQRELEEEEFRPIEVLV